MNLLHLSSADRATESEFSPANLPFAKSCPFNSNMQFTKIVTSYGSVISGTSRKQLLTKIRFLG